ncbi:hypothetical protein ACVIWU_006203 [Bradyrhizobium sp. USDA 4509]
MNYDNPTTGPAQRGSRCRTWPKPSSVPSEDAERRAAENSALGRNKRRRAGVARGCASASTNNMKRREEHATSGVPASGNNAPLIGKTYGRALQPVCGADAIIVRASCEGGDNILPANRRLNGIRARRRCDEIGAGDTARRPGPQNDHWSAQRDGRQVREAPAEDDKRRIAGCGTNRMLLPECPASRRCAMIDRAHNLRTAPYASHDKWSRSGGLSLPILGHLNRSTNAFARASGDVAPRESLAKSTAYPDTLHTKQAEEENQNARAFE